MWNAARRAVRGVFSAPFQLVLVIAFSLVAAFTILIGAGAISRTIRDYLIEADPAQLQEVIANLVSNASEAMPSGGRLTVRTRPGPEGMVTMNVTDTGVGITPEDQARLFVPFFTTKPVGKGTGLGLAIVYGIVKMHRGQITVQSQPGKGTTFTVTLPIRLLPMNPASWGTRNDNALAV